MMTLRSGLSGPIGLASLVLGFAVAASAQSSSGPGSGECPATFDEDVPEKLESPGLVCHAAVYSDEETRDDERKALSKEVMDKCCKSEDFFLHRDEGWIIMPDDDFACVRACYVIDGWPEGKMERLRVVDENARCFNESRPKSGEPYDGIVCGVAVFDDPDPSSSATGSSSSASSSTLSSASYSPTGNEDDNDDSDDDDGNDAESHDESDSQGDDGDSAGVRGVGGLITGAAMMGTLVAGVAQFV